MSVFEKYTDLVLPGKLSQAIAEMGFETPTPIQKEAIPMALLGKDILGTAQTGTGKTAAFGIPVLASLFSKPNHQALVLSPTRELSAQIYKVFKDLSRGSNLFGSLVVGGESFGRQKQELGGKLDFIVATPGRLNDHIEQRTVRLQNVRFLILDEADRMLDMGFLPQIENIIRKLPKERQTLLFSATMAKELMSLVDRMMKNPVRVAIDAVEKSAENVKEETIRTTQGEKNALLLKELSQRSGKILIFARTKSRSERLGRLLQIKGHRVDVLHGGKTQGQRKRALQGFRTGTHPILVATDLAGRGIDITDIETVINYDMPATREDYIHRIGRTGRAGKSGLALSFLADENPNDTAVAMMKRTPNKPQGAGAQHNHAQRPANGKPGAAGQNRNGFNSRKGAKPGRGRFHGASGGPQRRHFDSKEERPNKRALSTLPC